MKKRLGIWAGSSPSTRALYKSGLKHLKKLGIETVIPAGTERFACRAESRERPFIAGPDAVKVKAFLELWGNPEVSDILGVRGGYGTLRLLKALDGFDLRRLGKKMLWGFSDFTVLQNYLYERTGSPWVHSPFLTSHSFFAGRPVELKAWQKLRTPSAELAHFTLRTVVSPPRIHGGLHAPIIGGNLSCFVSLLGTPWEPRRTKKFFLFLEDVNEPAYRLDRLLQQLSGSTLFKGCQGVLLGQFTKCPKAAKVLHLWALENQIPLFSGLPAGHGRPNLPILMGVDAILTLKNRHTAELALPFPKLGC
jgi:muramoyltetrapeptide carboxypeptidase